MRKACFTEHQIIAVIKSVETGRTVFEFTFKLFLFSNLGLAEISSIFSQKIDSRSLGSASPVYIIRNVCPV